MPLDEERLLRRMREKHDVIVESSVWLALDYFH